MSKQLPAFDWEPLIAAVSPSARSDIRSVTTEPMLEYCNSHELRALMQQWAPSDQAVGCDA